MPRSCFISAIAVISRLLNPAGTGEELSSLDATLLHGSSQSSLRINPTVELVGLFTVTKEYQAT